MSISSEANTIQQKGFLKDRPVDDLAPVWSYRFALYKYREIIRNVKNAEHENKCEQLRITVRELFIPEWDIPVAKLQVQDKFWKNKTEEKFPEKKIGIDFTSEASKRRCGVLASGFLQCFVTKNCKTKLVVKFYRNFVSGDNLKSALQNSKPSKKNFLTVYQDPSKRQRQGTQQQPH